MPQNSNSVWGIAMKVINDANSEEGKKLIETMLFKYGSSAEHNYYCYIDKMEEFCASSKPYICMFEDFKGVLAKYDAKSGVYRIFMEIFAPQKEKAQILKRFLDHIFSLEHKPKKIWVELETETRKDVLNILKDTDYICNKINYTLIWPVFDMNVWDGDLMQGGEWKDLRYYWNKFFREHKTEFVTADSDKFNIEDMKKLVYEWKKNRQVSDRAEIDYYIKVIESGFRGYDVTRIMLVDGNIGAITAGFYSRPGYYYSSIGLYNTEIPRCNDIANMDDLINLKRLGCKVVDFGGVEEEHLEFKKKFRPTRYYKTHVFSIVLKNSKN
jgi:hypothetical protein